MENPFDEIFDAAFSDKRYENDEFKKADKSLYEHNFVWWLQGTKGLEQDNEIQYQEKFLNPEVFQEFLDHEGNKLEPEKYNKLVSEEAKKYINDFDKRFERSEEKERFLQKEIDKYEVLLKSEKWPLANPFDNSDHPLSEFPPEYSSYYISEIREFYDKIIVAAKERNYYSTPQNLRVEALVKYYYYLKGLKKKELELNLNKETPKENKPVFKPKLFKELFLNPGLISDCLTLLRGTTKPCINEANEFLRDKGVFVVWFYVLENKKILNYTFANDDERARTLNLNFPNLNISGSLFRSPNARAKSNYKNNFENEVAAIKY